MIDRYENFAALAAQETAGTHYRIRAIRRDSPVLIMAPHGGFIEPGTHLVAGYLAGERHSYYAFETLEPRASGQGMHIASRRFDEPQALALVAGADIVLTVHGRKDKDDPWAAWVGGRHDPLRDAIAAALGKAGLAAKAVGDGHPLSGRDVDNICNRGRAGAGVQLELPARLRQALVRESEKREAFIRAIHVALAHYDRGQAWGH
jgi:phage replication-related protein YjqB (UPF0714/DUF867 family)